MAYVSKRVLLPIAESPPSKRSCSSRSENETKNLESDVVVIHETVSEDNTTNRGVLQPRIFDREFLRTLSYRDIPAHLWTDAQHEDDCECLMCQLDAFHRESRQ